MDFVVRRQLNNTNNTFVYVRSQWSYASCADLTPEKIPPPDNETDDNVEASFFIEATDGLRAWRCATDVKYPEEGHAAPASLWYRYAHTALSTQEHDEDKQQACLETTVNAANNDNLQVRWSWQESQTRWSAKVDLQIASPSDVRRRCVCVFRGCRTNHNNLIRPSVIQESEVL